MAARLAVARVGQQAVEAIERQGWLDRLGDRLQGAVRGIFEAAGGSGQRAADVLHGTWLGHPLHPVLTDIPVGAWTATFVLDLLSLGRDRGDRRYAEGADAALAVGIAGAVGAAVTGLTDWHRTDGRDRRTGLVHGLLNSGALLLYGASLVLRARHARAAGVTLAGVGFGVVFASAYLGGHLVYRRRIGVDHAPEIEPLDAFVDCAALGDLVEGQPRPVEVRGTSIVLVRGPGAVHALAARCSHLGGPLSAGRVQDDTIACPWHGSRFDLGTGAVVNGPATAAQPCYETRVRAGRVEVRRRR